MRCSHQRERLLGTSSIQCLETNSVRAGQVFNNLYCSLFLSLDLHGILLFFLIHFVSLYYTLYMLYLFPFPFFSSFYLSLFSFTLSSLSCSIFFTSFPIPILVSLFLFSTCIKMLSKCLQHACNEGCKCLFQKALFFLFALIPQFFFPPSLFYHLEQNLKAQLLGYLI